MQLRLCCQSDTWAEFELCLTIGVALFFRLVWIERMSLASVLKTARSGMAAAVTSVEAVSHNLANSRTNGYKAIRPVFAEQPAWTRGTLQIGTGVQVTGFTTDNSPGPLVATSDGVIELSNTDIGEEIISLILAEDQFKANTVVFDAAAGMLDVLLDLRRRAN